MDGLDPRGSRAGLGLAFSEGPEMLLLGGTRSQHRGPLCKLPGPKSQYFGPASAHLIPLLLSQHHQAPQVYR